MRSRRSPVPCVAGSVVRAFLVAAAATPFVPVVMPDAALAQQITYSGSLEFATGKYLFTESTRSAYFLTGLAVEAGRLRLSATLPLIYQSTPWISYSTGGGIPTGGPQQGEVADSLGRRGGSGNGGMGMGSRAGLAAALLGAGGTGSMSAGGLSGASGAMRQAVALPDTATFDQVGVGDPTLRLAVDLVPPGRRDFSVTVAGQVKAPLADPTRGFGTGEWDGGGSLSVARRLGSTLLFGELGYWILGDLPDLELRNPVSFSVGVGQRIAGGKLSVLASLSGTSRILAETDPPLDVGGGIGYRLGEGRSLGVSVSVGLSESSPDLAVSAGWQIGL